MKMQHGSPAMKRILTAAMALCLLLSCLIPAFAQGNDYIEWPNTGKCGPNATYTLADGVLTISGTGEVTKHYDEWPRELYSPTKLVIEEGITSLSLTTFYLTNIIQADLPDSLTYIGAMAFSNTPWKNAQTDEFVIVGGGVLLDYNGPGGEVTVPDTVCSIAGSAFAGSEITSITVGDSVKQIGSYAFSHCSKLEHVSISNTISDIEENILEDTPWLNAQTEEFVLVGDNVLIAYKGPGGAVTVPDTVHAISRYALRYYQGTEDLQEIPLTELTIPDTVVKIAASAFEGGNATNGKIEKPPLVVRCAPGSVAEQHCSQYNASYNLMKVILFGQEDSGLSNFIPIHFYYKNFVDVAEDDWFDPYIKVACETGLMNGKGSMPFLTYEYFVPAGDIKLSEAITVAARMRDIYYEEQTNFKAEIGAMWYQPYVDYALANKIIAEVPKELNRPATRAEFASMLAAVLPEREMEVIHNDIHFVDIDEIHPAYDAVMLLAGAGVMEGKGEGRFDPDAQVKRCEAAAMLARCVRTEHRIQPDLT